MYTTKRYHTNADTGFIGVGTPYVTRKANSSLDPIYVAPRYKGKQFACEKTDGIFTKYDYKGDPYMDRTRFLASQPLDHRKLGFGSHDAWKRTEFTNTPRSLQHCEVVARETKWMKKWNREHDGSQTERGTSSSRTGSRLSRQGSRASGRGSRSSKKPRGSQHDKHHLPPLFQEAVPRFLYEIGRTEEGSTRHCYKCPRDTFFCKHRLGQTGYRRQESIGGYGYGTRDAPLASKNFARVCRTKEFFDSGHMHTSQG